MDTEARKRAEAAFVKAASGAVAGNAAWNEHKTREAAVDANAERLKALRLARDEQVVTPPPGSKTTLSSDP